MRTRTLLLLLPALLAGPALADDWPQWRGPRRDDVSRETGLLKAWPPGGPKSVWVSDQAGIGYSGPAVVGDRVYVLGADEKAEFALALDAHTGKKVWFTEIGAFYKNSYGSGPRSTPTVDGDVLFVLGANGDLACLEAATGAKRWSVSLTKDLGGQQPNWGYSESPLVDGDRVICTPGGAKGTLAALDKATGKALWRSEGLTDWAAYSSCVAAEIGGVRQYVQLTMQGWQKGGVVGVAAKDGRKLWYYEHPKYKTAVIPTPIVHDGLVYAAAGYGAGCVLLKPTRDGDTFKVEQLYDDAAMRLMDNKHEGVVLVGGHVYGWSDRGKWVCQDFKTGKEVWSSKALGRGSVACAGGDLYCYSEDDGTAVLVPASPDGWKEKGRFTIPRHTRRREYKNNIWTHPVVANGRLYLRDQELLFCYDVSDVR
jgi:outer membrane protein assembly factor BamB